MHVVFAQSTVCSRQDFRAAMLWLAMAFGLFAAATSHGVVNGTEPVCDDVRYDAVGLLLTALNPVNNPCALNISGTCVLVDSDTVLMARHSIIASSTQPLPLPGARKFKVRFRRALDGRSFNSYFAPGVNNCHGIYQEYYIHEFFRPGNVGMDVLMGRLEAVPAGIAPIPAETDYRRMPAQGDRIAVAGWGYSGACFQTGNALTLKVGTGVVPVQSADGCCIAINPCSTPFSQGTCFTCPTPPAGKNWVLPNYFDSGAPVLVETTCIDAATGRRELRVVGITSSTTSAWRTSSWNNSGTDWPLYPPPATCEPCRADYNTDAEVDLADLLDFFDAWTRATCAADLDASGTVDLSDLLDYFDLYSAGCR